jgi:biotin carboxylase
MTARTVDTVLCLSSYFKGNRFLGRCRAEGCRVVLLTVEAAAKRPWARDAIDDLLVLPKSDDRAAVIRAIERVARDRPLETFVALDDFDVELVASLREHFRVPGMGETVARLFRDKLAMRIRAEECGILIPAFTPLLPDSRVDRFLRQVPGPWLLKPRSQASAIGIKRLATADQARRAIDALGDARSYHLLEAMIDGDLYHVDSLVSEGEVVFAVASRYHRPLLEVYQGGGVFASRTLAAGDPEAVEVTRLNREVLARFGLRRGASHTEFMRGREDRRFYFIETSARVGGAGITDMVEAATGLNLWEEWASIELRPAVRHEPVPARSECGAVLMSLARQEHPDPSGFDDPEVFRRLDEPHHIGLVLRSPSADRIDQLLARYQERILRDFHAVLPPAERATF